MCIQLLPAVTYDHRNNKVAYEQIFSSICGHPIIKCIVGVITI